MEAVADHKDVYKRRFYFDHSVVHAHVNVVIRLTVHLSFSFLKKKKKKTFQFFGLFQVKNIKNRKTQAQ
jgi:hypothetical protein